MEKKRELWIDVMRGLAIIAVVVCHQQGTLHESNIVQCITLYAVPSFILMMGITKVMSLQRYYDKTEKPDLLHYTFTAIKPVLLSYVVATIVCERMIGGQTEAMPMLEALVSFDAVDPFYFVKHYLRLSIYAPIIYIVAEKIYRCESTTWKICGNGILVIGSWLIGYFSPRYLDIFGKSYFFVYVIGMMIGIYGLPRVNWKVVLAEVGLLLFGSYAVQRFFFARLEGNLYYNEFIDVIDPNLQLNPPNLSVIIYSFAVVGLVYIGVNLFGDRISHISAFLAFIGKYSMDIFLWHIWVQVMLKMHCNSVSDNMWIRRIVFYGLMFGIPIVGRIIWERIKAEMNQSRVK